MKVQGEVNSLIKKLNKTHRMILKKIKTAEFLATKMNKA